MGSWPTQSSFCGAMFPLWLLQMQGTGYKDLWTAMTFLLWFLDYPNKWAINGACNCTMRRKMRIFLFNRRCNIHIIYVYIYIYIHIHLHIYIYTQYDYIMVKQATQVITDPDHDKHIKMGEWTDQLTWNLKWWCYQVRNSSRDPCSPSMLVNLSPLAPLLPSNPRY